MLKINKKAGEKPGFLAGISERSVRYRINLKTIDFCGWRGARCERSAPQVNIQAEVKPSSG